MKLTFKILVELLIFYFLFYSCSSGENSKIIEYQKIWSNNILSIEFTESDTVPFYSDTSAGSIPKKVVFLSMEEFEESELLGIPSSLKEWINPLKFDKRKFVLNFETKKVNEDWLCLKNSYSSSNKEFLWIPYHETINYDILSWQEFLMSLEEVKMFHGDLLENLRTSPSLEAKIINKPNIACLRIERIINEVWLEVAYTSYCEDLNYENIGYLMWTDTDNNLLLKF